MREGKSGFIPLLEIAAGLLIVAGFGGSLWWFAAETLRLQDFQHYLEAQRNDFEEKMLAARQADEERIQQGLAAVQEAQVTIGRMRQEAQAIQKETRREVERLEKVQQSSESALARLQKSLTAVETLQKKFASFESVEQARNGSKEKVILRGAGQVFFRETFNDYEVGEMPTEWGEGVAISRDLENPKDQYLAGMSQTAGFVRRAIPFPRNFRLEFTMRFLVRSGDWLFKLEDDQGKTVSITYQSRGIQQFVLLTGAAYVEVGHLYTKETDTFQLEVKGENVRFFINDTFVCSSTVTGLGTATQIYLKKDDWKDLWVDNFYGTDLGEEVKPGGRKG